MLIGVAAALSTSFSAECAPAQSVAFIVPYRRRDLHVKTFVHAFEKYWPRHFPCDVLHILVVEQGNNNPFNRAWLGNVGLKELQRFQLNVDCIVFHDVDLLPWGHVPYTACGRPILLGSELEHHKWGIPYAQFSGAVVSMSLDHWKAVNGFSNMYVGWGGEDDDLYLRIVRAGFLKPGQPMPRPPKGSGRFNATNESPEHHPRIRDGTYQKSLRLLAEMGGGSDRWKTDGLNSVKYVITRRVPSRSAVWLVADSPSEP